jgi:hypothetical protein
MEQTKALGGLAAFDEMDHQENYRHKKKQVNQRAGDMEYDKAGHPSKDEHNREKN